MSEENPIVGHTSLRSSQRRIYNIALEEAMTSPRQSALEAVAEAARKLKAEWQSPLAHLHKNEIFIAENELGKALAALDALGPADTDDGWRPIETAPKSTSTDTPHGKYVKSVYILAYCPDEGATPESCITVCWWEPNMDNGKGRWQGDADYPYRPTHWRPLPAPPQRAQLAQQILETYLPEHARKAERKHVRNIVERAVRACPSIDENGYICEKAAVLRAIADALDADDHTGD